MNETLWKRAKPATEVVNEISRALPVTKPEAIGRKVFSYKVFRKRGAREGFIGRRWPKDFASE